VAQIEDRIYSRAPGWLQTVLLNAHALRVAHHRYGPRHRKALGWLVDRERSSADEIRAYQSRRLCEIVKLAYNNTESCRSRFDKIGLSPADIRGVEDLRFIPLLTKDELRTQEQQLLNTNSPRKGWLNGHTSGTTGMPLSIWYDRWTCILTNAIDRQHKSWAGAAFDDWFAVLLGRTVVPPATTSPPFWRANHVQRQLWMSSFHLSDAWMPLYVDELRRRKIRFIEGYPSTLYTLANFILGSGTQLPLKAAISSSETLHETQREVIEHAFQCRLFDFYASAERVVFSAECETHSGKHISEEYGIVEVVDDSGAPVPDGTPGVLVGTTLHNTAMPLLRYQLGDVTMIHPDRCSCGRTSRLMANVTTKAEDVVIRPDGRIISPSILTHPFKPIHGLIKSQIIQDRIDHVTVNLVIAESFSAIQQDALLAALRERLGESIELEIRVVDDIPREPSGKYRWVISRVERPGKIDWEGAAS
jgi:phenylacetate-coenzyme A ligase PaaK-like adenylate-forming protein